MQKLNHYMDLEKSKLVCISDDSGIEISALNNRPGIFSARWAGKQKTLILQ